jgi:hypothetical protein
VQPPLKSGVKNNFIEQNWGMTIQSSACLKTV